MELYEDDPKRHTVEFRQPPGAINAGQASFWLNFTLAFVQGAAAFVHRVGGCTPGCNITMDANEPATIEGLLHVLDMACLTVPELDYRILSFWIKCTTKLDDGPWEEDVFEANDEARIKLKQRTSQMVSDGLAACAEKIEWGDLPFAEGNDE
jgi:hypothetical protein